MHKRKLVSVPFRDRLKCTITEASEYGGISRSRIEAWIKVGCIKSTIVDTRRLIDVPSLLAILDGEEDQEAAARRQLALKAYHKSHNKRLLSPEAAQ